jgi:hypothetical protein
MVSAVYYFALLYLSKKCIVTCSLKARISEQEKTSIDRKWLCKHISTAIKSLDCRNRCTHNTKGTARGGVLRWVFAEVK